MATDSRPEKQRPAPARDRTETHGTAAHPANPLATPEMQFDLAAEAVRLRKEDVYARTGRNGITLVKYPDLRVVLTVLRAGARIEGHQTEGRVSVHTLTGTLRLHVAGKTVDLAPGGLLALDHGIAHDVEAADDSVFLLTLAAHGK